ncbi:hypothetical protein AgCh_027098 [Apium graveolens]
MQEEGGCGRRGAREKEVWCFTDNGGSRFFLAMMAAGGRWKRPAGREGGEVVRKEVVKMAMCLEGTYHEYLSRIYDGPHRPMKLAVAIAGQEKKMVDKSKKDYTTKDLSSIMKDAKARHILHSTLDSVMSNRVIGCKTLRMLNDLSLVNKEYDLEDSNLKFLLALREKQEFKVTSIRDNYELEEIYLDEIYGILKTHELEMEQISKRKGSKSRPTALKVEDF